MLPMRIEQRSFVNQMMPYLNIWVSQYVKQFLSLFFSPLLQASASQAHKIGSIINHTSCNSWLILIVDSPMTLIYSKFFLCKDLINLPPNPTTRLLITIYIFLCFTPLHYHITISHLRCCGLNVCSFIPSKFICWSPNLQCAGFRRWGLWEVIRFKWGHENGASVVGLVPNKKRKRYQSTLSPPHEDTVRRWPCGSQEEGPYQDPKLPAPSSLTFQPPELYEINVCCLSYQFYAILL